MKLKKFLDKYDTVIFDMDGVITSEQNYWNCAALTVWEYIAWNSHKTVDTEWAEQHMKEIRASVFCDDKIIEVLKSKGVNSNWDLGYVVVLLAWICGGKEYSGDFFDVLKKAEELPDNILDAYDDLAKKASERTGFDYDWLRRNELMWQTMTGLFQEWFLGDELNGASMHGKKSGLLNNEQPIVDKEKLKTMLRLLSEKRRVCTGTGRPYIEMIRPLDAWDIKKYFASDGLINYDHVVAAEKTLNNNALTKPHPYMFLKALYGTDYDDKKLIDGDYDRDKIKTTLIVGDAGADILAAQAMGADFCAVLTGVNGKKARGYFEEQGAEYILNSVEDFIGG